MDATLLTAIFRNALRASLVVPLVSACGGQTSTGNTASSDSGTATDSGKRRSDASAGQDAAGHTSSASSGNDCPTNEGCATGGCSCGTTTACVNGQWQCSCTPCPPLLDSGNACKPTLGQCTTTPIPLTCFDGGLPDASQNDPSYGSLCEALCGDTVGSCYLGPAQDGGRTELQCTTYCSAGRSFEGFLARTPKARSSLHEHFAGVASMEAAAVDAFLILADELVAHEAPEALVLRARDAARDEARHWKATRPLALRYGECPKPRRASKRPARALLEVAIENAVEGCVRETYGALVAHHQALAASDPDVRRVMTEIADDETRHAALGWAVASWAGERLTASERETVAKARAQAVADMSAALEQEVPRELVAVAGVPDAVSATRMVASLSQTLWS